MIPAAIERFSCVEDVFVYSLVEEELLAASDNGNGKKFRYRIDNFTINIIVPFLSNLAELKYYFVGGLTKENKRSRTVLRMVFGAI